MAIYGRVILIMKKLDKVEKILYILGEVKHN